MTSLASIKEPMVRGVVGRFTSVDACGMPKATNSSVVTEGLITISVTKNIDAGDTISQRLMNGRIGVFRPGRQTLTNMTADINLSDIDPAVITMLTGDPVVLSADGDTIVGWEELALVPLEETFAMELWTETGSDFCLASNPLAGYMLYPYFSEAYLTIDNVSDGLISAHIMAQTHGSPEWGRGPYDVVAGADGTTPSRLAVAVDPKAHRHFEWTIIQPPAPTSSPGPVGITLPSPY